MLEYRIFVRQTANPLSKWMERAAFRTQIERDRYQDQLVLSNPTWAVRGRAAHDLIVKNFDAEEA